MASCGPFERWDRVKDPDETIDYGGDFISLLNGATIISADIIEINTSDLTISNIQIANNTIAQAYIAGGTSGVRYMIEITVTTDESPAQIHQRTGILSVRDR